jgi:hypothetical protein
MKLKQMIKTNGQVLTWAVIELWGITPVIVPLAPMRPKFASYWLNPNSNICKPKPQTTVRVVLTTVAMVSLVL